MTTTKAIAKKQEKSIVYEVGGNEIKLTESIIKQFITRGNGEITQSEAVNFMMWCSHNKLDPFNYEAYLVKFGNQSAQQLTGKSAFMRRAEEDKNYDGFKAGIVILAKDGQLVEREGAICLKTETLIGGWCEVYVKDKRYPVKDTVSLDEYDKKQSTWKTMPATMIRKVAMVQAYREAFPTSLGGLYVEDEMPSIKEDSVKATIQKVKQEIQEEPTETLDMPFDQEPIDAEIVEDEKLDF